jgi:PHD/YefM family antitoxin component YafN of YafNO toxin-antitoxin module
VTELAKAGPVILTRHGKPLAAVKDLSHADWESIALAITRGSSPALKNHAAPTGKKEASALMTFARNSV